MSDHDGDSSARDLSPGGQAIADRLDGGHLMDGPEPSPYCTATSKRTGLRCRRRVPGGGPCRFHGGAAGQVRRPREARIALAQAQRMYAMDFAERDPGDVLMGTVADIDSVVQRIKGQVERRETLTATDLVLLRDWLELAAKWSSVVLNGRLEERKVRINEATAQQFIELLTLIMNDPTVGLTPEQRAAVHPAAVRRLRALQ